MVHPGRPLFDDLFTLDSVATGTLLVRRQRVDVKSIVALAVETCAPVISACTHRFEIRLPQRAVFIDADSTSLAQAILNLLDNAAKYSAPWGQVTLSVGRRDGEVMICVQDDGIGIASEMLRAIFGLFVQRGSTLTGERHGMGIGLHLAKHIVELHDGRVEAQSEGRKEVDCPRRENEFLQTDQ